MSATYTCTFVASRALLSSSSRFLRFSLFRYPFFISTLNPNLVSHHDNRVTTKRSQISASKSEKSSPEGLISPKAQPMSPQASDSIRRKSNQIFLLRRRSRSVAVASVLLAIKRSSKKLEKNIIATTAAAKQEGKQGKESKSQAQAPSRTVSYRFFNWGFVEIAERDGDERRATCVNPVFDCGLVAWVELDKDEIGPLLRESFFEFHPNKGSLI